MQRSLRDLLVALSLSNLLFLKGWLDLLEGYRHPYFRKDMSLYWSDSGALLLDVVLLAGVFWLAVFLARRVGRVAVLGFVRWVFLGICVFFLFMLVNVLRRYYPFLSLRSLEAQAGQLAAIGFGLVVVSVVVFLLFRARPVLVRVAVTLLLMLSPFVLFTPAKALWLGMQNGASVSLLEVTPETVEEKTQNRYPANAAR